MVSVFIPTSIMTPIMPHLSVHCNMITQHVTHPDMGHGGSVGIVYMGVNIIEALVNKLFRPANKWIGILLP